MLPLQNFLSCPPSFSNLEDSINSISIAVAVIATFVGVILSFCGYQLNRVTFLLCGLLSGMGLTYAVARDQVGNLQLPFEGTIGVYLVALAGGLVLGLLALGIKPLGLFLVGMDTAFLFAATAIGFIAHFLTIEKRSQTLSNDNAAVLFSSPFPNRWLPISGIILSCLIGGLGCLFKPRYCLILGSSVIGTSMFMFTFGYFLESENPLRPIRFVAASIIGTRYMQTHYGRYVFEYVPVSEDYHQLPNSSSSIRFHSTTPKESSIPAFLCWSDFVIVACWLLASAFTMAFQLTCSFKFPRKKRKKRKGSRRSKSRSRSKKSSRESPAESYCRPQNVRVSSHAELPPYSEAVNARHTPSRIHHHAEAWYSQNLNSLASNRNSPNRDGDMESQSSGSAAYKWMAMASYSTPAANFNSTGKQQQYPSSINSPASVGAGQMFRVRRSLGDVLSRDFISHCVAPRIPQNEPSSSHC